MTINPHSGPSGLGPGARRLSDATGTILLPAKSDTGFVDGRVYADQKAVAASNRSWHDVQASGRWAG
jgi:hypothetical protein